jgi:ubiquitin carboxyl-terminal hydrolase 25
MAREALRIIAEHRDSSSLKQQLAHGGGDEAVEKDMDVKDAFVALQVDDTSLDDDTLMTAYEIRRFDAPGDADRFKAALKAIGKARNSQKILSLVDSGKVSEVAKYEGPVGLENIGNTCYLNSLLQFYFSVKPLRTLILDFDKYKMELTPENLSQKRVGSRKVALKEVQRSQKCRFYSSTPYITSTDFFSRCGATNFIQQYDHSASFVYNSQI